MRERERERKGGARGARNRAAVYALFWTKKFSTKCRGIKILKRERERERYARGPSGKVNSRNYPLHKNKISTGRS